MEIEDINRALFALSETGLVNDNGDGTFTITEKGCDYVEGMIARKAGGEE